MGRGRRPEEARRGMRFRSGILFIITVLILSAALSCTSVPDDSDFIPFVDELGGKSGQHFEDALGDHFGTGQFLYDILSTDVYIGSNETYLIVHVTFNNSVHAPTGAMNMDELVGYLEIDADQDSLTGIVSIIDGYAPSQGEPLSNLGVEYEIYFFEYDSMFHTLPIREASTFTLTGYANVLYGGNTCTLQIPLGALGDDDGSIDFGFIIGTTFEPTDMAYPYSYVVE
jgi:hypothetical protein